MKLKTMLLPTGEFIIVGENAPQDDLPPNELMSEFAKATGAAGVLFTRHDVEVEDALFDENARRRPDEPEPVELEDTDEATELHQHFSTYVSHFKQDIPSFTVDSDGTAHLSGTAQASGWIDIGEMSKEALETTFGVRFDREYGPAGQVKGQPGDPDFLNDPDFAQGREPRVVEGEFHEVVANSSEPFGTPLPEPAQQLLDQIIGESRPAYEPHPGDHVKIVMVNGWDENPEDNPHTGREGVVVGPYGKGQGLWLVDDGSDGPYVACSQLELVERPAEPVPQVGDTVRIVGLSSWHEEVGDELRDVVGKVVPSQYPEHGILVEFTHPNADYPRPECRWFFPPASLEVVS